jgi:regulator of nucleoside diphosphate kinase
MRKDLYLAPLGTALPGLSVGQSIVWPFPGGSMRTLRVVQLLYQPEAAEREL